MNFICSIVYYFLCVAAKIGINSLSLPDMEMHVRHTGYKIVGVLVACLCLFACSPVWEDEFEIDYERPSFNPGDRVGNEETRNVLLLYSAGFNSLTSYLKEDIEDLKSGWLPGRNRNDDVVLVYSHFPTASGRYSVPNPPTLTRLSATSQGVVKADTLVVYDNAVISSSPVQFNRVLTYVKETFPAAGYGLVFSSHATGYLPAGFYQSPGTYVYKGNAMVQMGAGWHGASMYPYVEPPYDPSLPAVKSVGQDQVGTSDGHRSYEMELDDFAAAIPMKLDYILFDACLMGGIEVAYQLREKASVIGFSQAEVLAEGLNYKMLTSHLLQNGAPDPVVVCQDYFNQYDVQEGLYRSATISTVDCDQLEPLADICKVLFDKYASEISSLSHSNVQRYYRSNYHWFYDLESILVEAGITDAELESLHKALDKCVLYRGHTPSFMNAFEIKTFSGFSMYLPSHGNAELNKYYRTLDWNIATGLVR